MARIESAVFRQIRQERVDARVHTNRSEARFFLVAFIAVLRDASVHGSNGATMGQDQCLVTAADAKDRRL